VTGIEGLAAARLWAATKFPYLATGVFGAQVIARVSEFRGDQGLDVGTRQRV
jgi:hypothetical protein